MRKKRNPINESELMELMAGKIWEWFLCTLTLKISLIQDRHVSTTFIQVQ
ncbi:hypothetical protein [Candidatus Ornithobacterium hominis]|nr:hypothetical protein [Candidatus Ornithobacterium hominis]